MRAGVHIFLVWQTMLVLPFPLIKAIAVSLGSIVVGFVVGVASLYRQVLWFVLMAVVALMTELFKPSGFAGSQFEALLNSIPIWGVCLASGLLVRLAFHRATLRSREVGS